MPRAATAKGNNNNKHIHIQIPMPYCAKRIKLDYSACHL